MVGLIDLLASAFQPVAPAAVPTPRLRPSPVGPLANKASPPRIVMTQGSAGSNVGMGEPLSVEPADDPSSAVDPYAAGADPYADAPRIQPRTGLRRTLYNAAAGINASPWNDTPLAAVGHAYAGAANAEREQTAGDRTAAIDEINRKIELAKMQREAARQDTNDEATNAERAARTRVLNAQADAGGFASRKGAGLDDAKYYDLLIRKENELNQKYGLNSPNLSVSDPRRATAQAAVAKEMEAYREQLDASMGKTKPDENGGSDPANGNTPQTVEELEQRLDPAASGEPTKLLREKRIVSTPKGAVPDNITGDGSLQHPFRVKDARDPTLKSKILVGDHFIYLNPTTGKEEIRVRDR